jgi:hypothetical protein
MSSSTYQLYALLLVTMMTSCSCKIRGCRGSRLQRKSLIDEDLVVSNPKSVETPHICILVPNDFPCSPSAIVRVGRTGFRGHARAQKYHTNDIDFSGPKLMIGNLG